MDIRGLYILFFVASVWSATNKRLLRRNTFGRCSDDICEPSYGNLLIGREKNLTTNSTCGTRGKEQYCVVSHLYKPNDPNANNKKNCFICESSRPYSRNNRLSHSIENVLQIGELDKNKWWQSKHGEQKVYVQLDLEAEFHFLYLHFQCKTFLPAAMLVERSHDFGKTWKVYRYFAQDCEREFPGIPTYSRDISVPYCTSEFSESPDKLNREVLLTILPPEFVDPNPYKEEILNVLKMTNLRINFTRLHKLGDHYLFQDANRNYYYTIYNMVVKGRCSCYGHSNKCIPLPWQKNVTDAVYGQCDCTHHTTGYNCERCEDFYQDLPWRPRSTDNLNECKKCECHGHSNKCHFDPAVFVVNNNRSGGVCDDCQHNTMGQHCELCKTNYYRNLLVSIDHPDSCIHCDCDPRGSEVLGECESTTDPYLGTEAGRCNCKRFVIGNRCDMCQVGYWNLNENNPDGCEPCACNTYGTVAGHQCEFQAGECRCKRFVTGRTCDSCLPGYWNFGRDEEGCTACNCDIGGAYDSQCDLHTGQCRCRPNIIGQHCNNVAKDHYYPFLDWLIYEAELATGHQNTQVFHRDRMLSGGQVTWTGSGFMKVMEGSSLTFVVDNIPHSMDYDILIRYEYRLLYSWEGVRVTIERSGRASERGGCANTTPQDYNKVFSIEPNVGYVMIQPSTCFERGVRYTIKFDFPTLRYGSGRGDVHALIDSLVLLPGSTGHPLTQRPEVYRVYEQFKRHRCMEVYHTPVRRQRESDICRRLVFSSSVAIHDGAKSCDCDPHGSYSYSCEVAGGQCQCKPNVIGRRCDQCAPGFYGLTHTGCMACDCHSQGSTSPVCDQRTGQCPCNSNSFGLKCGNCQRGFWGFPNCRRCSCNGRAEECDQLNGVCVGCRGNSGGVNCERCADGYYGDLNAGCQRCPCKQSGSCRWDARINQVVCDCPTGYTGPRCDQCADNYFGDPSYPGGTCQMCMCNNNIDLNVPGSCDSRTGECTRCLYNTEGRFCDRCKAGFYGDALRQDCKPCICNILGTHPHLRNECDRITGQCHCLSHVVGRSCDQCEVNHWKLADGRGCEPCDCDPYGSLSQKCNEIDGQCQCKRDFGGRKCSECGDNFWGDPRSACQPCRCNREGSVSQQCDRHTGACTCNPGVTGYLCDQCDRGTTGVLPHCRPCGPCYDGWLKVIMDITIDLATLAEQSQGYNGGGSSYNFIHEIHEMTQKLDEISRIVDRYYQDSGSSAGSDELMGILKIIYDIQSKLTMYGQEAGEIDSNNRQIMDDTTRVSNRLMYIKSKLNEYERIVLEISFNLTSIVEYDIKGAYESIKESHRISNSAWFLATDTCHNIKRTSENTRRETDSILERKKYEMEHGGGGGGGSTSVNVDQSLGVFNVFISDANRKVCGAKTDHCGVCGGAGCNSCGGRLSCQDSCVEQSERALKKAKEARDVLNRKRGMVDVENNKMMTLINMCHSSKDYLAGILGDMSKFKNITIDRLHEVHILLRHLLTNASESNRPEDLRNLLNKILGMKLPYKDEELRRMFELILKASWNISNAESILRNTKLIKTRVENLKKNALDAKNTSISIHIRVTTVRDLLHDVDNKRDRIIRELTDLKRRVEEVDDKLSKANKTISDSNFLSKYSELTIYDFTVRTNKIKAQFDSNSQTASELESQAYNLNDKKEQLLKTMKNVESSFQDFNMKVQGQPQVTLELQNKINHIVSRSQYVKNVLSQWHGVLKRWNNSYSQRIFSLKEYVRQTQVYMQTMVKLVPIIRNKQSYHYSCGTS